MCQLPRLWWKASLKAAGLLAEDYPECTGFLDEMVLERCGLEVQVTLEHIHSVRPDYLTFEQWVREQTQGGPETAVQQEWNTYVRGRIHKQGKIDGINHAVGLPADGGVDSAVVLNHLEDWHYYFERDLNGQDLSPWQGKVVPLISSLDIGPLGLVQLARTWHKVQLEGAGLLHPDYPGCGGGLDRRLIVEALEMEVETVIEYLQGERPGYLALEAWILDQISDREGLGSRTQVFNASVVERIHVAEKRADIHNNLGRVDDGSLPQQGVVLNHVEDWHYAHSAIIAR
jgi:hypothetical protein